jgi:hypothetical protein
LIELKKCTTPDDLLLICLNWSLGLRQLFLFLVVVGKLYTPSRLLDIKDQRFTSRTALILVNRFVLTFIATYLITAPYTKFRGRT